MEKAVEMRCVIGDPFFDDPAGGVDDMEIGANRRLPEFTRPLLVVKPIRLPSGEHVGTDVDVVGV
jgi:hypothetical protein